MPVDLIGGNSMRALIGAKYANAMSLEEVLERTRRSAMGGTAAATVDLAAFRAAILARSKSHVRRVDHSATVASFFAAACNLTRVETTRFDSAPLWRAVLASNSSADLLPGR